jgi:sugar/nucleoside kinase (ribokinase family)
VCAWGSTGAFAVELRGAELGAAPEPIAYYEPARRVEQVVDSTGAGDTFAGGFIGYLARTQDHSFDNLKRAIIVGSALASFTCVKFGIERLVEISREDIDERIQQFVDLVDFDIELVEG